ncbi:hypothetical protein FA048_08885 [Pedobacter polaris]|uniref:Signal transduction histidine kinase internal region domain-containing protein n=1 Tax=Pedobacter polaris TaxID=2571273 RepID=A0A4U1CQC4_9SPHI|nr:histidine kinase [Pedobacter polaris]TKC10297.1 hypothetical protein FA048_08885 [Pedobacter polaris]
MNFLNLKKITIKQLQWLAWIAIFLVSFFSMVTVDAFTWSLTYSLINTGFYAIIIYGNINWLFPRYYERNKKFIYVILVIVFLTLCGFGRGYLITFVYNTFFSIKPITIEWYRLIYLSISGIVIFILSFMLRIVLAYFVLKQQTEDILLQKTTAELNLLKSQVQPHFLFNTLNNIYYEAYLEAPKTAELIERLAAMMRYFVDESPKTEVTISTELNFLENYIALEKIRIRHQISINFIKDYSTDHLLPPMLMMTFVENIFKHGIDKLSDKNQIEITLTALDGNLLFKTVNSSNKNTVDKGGFGIENLKKRLTILYGNRFELHTELIANCYTAYFKIPI